MALRFLNSGYFAGKVGIGTDSPDAQLDIGVNNIYITGRNIDNVVKFKKDLHNSKIYENQKVDLIVNATKAGTLKEGEIFEYINYSDKLIDLNVCKKDTYLVSSALSLGIEVIKGSEMSINQLKKQFEIKRR